MNDPEHCDRCQRAMNDPSGLPSDWEAIIRPDESVGIICPGCVTDEEHQEIHEGILDLQEEIERRGLRDDEEAER